MKKVYTFNPFLFITAFLILSFGINPAKAQDNSDVKKSAEATSPVFVQMKDGTIKNFTTLKMVTGIMMSPHLVADGRVVINGDEIRSYQDDDQHYAVSQKSFESGRRTHLALEILPGFVQRIAAGKLNVYKKESFNGYRKVEEFFVQSGTDGSILPYSESRLNDLVKDEPEAMKLFNCKNKKQTLLEKLQLTAGMVNSSGLMSKN
jgi:hypothetical protein